MSNIGRREDAGLASGELLAVAPSIWICHECGNSIGGSGWNGIDARGVETKGWRGIVGQAEGERIAIHWHL
jgi:hypothetical protein